MFAAAEGIVAKQQAQTAVRRPTEELADGLSEKLSSTSARAFGSLILAPRRFTANSGPPPPKTRQRSNDAYDDAIG